MRTFYSFLPTLTAFIALVLGLLCLFAGTSTKVLVSADHFTVGTPSDSDGAMGLTRACVSILAIYTDDWQWHWNARLLLDIYHDLL